MLNGFDDIDYLQNIKEDIVAFADKLPYYNQLQLWKHPLRIS
jgi:uncharacterized protein (DUF1919 family)